MGSGSPLTAWRPWSGNSINRRRPETEARSVMCRRPTIRQATMCAMTINCAAASATLTWTAAEWATRRDLIVKCVNDPTLPTGQFHFDTAHIVINLAAFTDGADDVLITDHPALLGVLLHEVGHAEHTPKRVVPPTLRAWVNLLEEPRIEGRMRDAHPRARDWLRQSGMTALKVREATSVADAAETIILAYGRVCAGVLADDDVAEVLSAPMTLVEPSILAVLQSSIESAVTLDDSDATGILVAAARIAAVIDAAGGDATQSAAIIDHNLTASSTNEQQPPDISADPAVTATALLADPPPAGATDLAAVHARRVTTLSPVSATTRPPHPHETAALTSVGSWLQGAVTPRELPTRHSSSRPPGKLDIRQVMWGQAQTDMGQVVTAAPWTRPRRAFTATQSIEIGIIVDRSYSARTYLDEAAGAAWVLTQSLAASHAGRARTWVFSDCAEVLADGLRDQVTVPKTGSGSSALPSALVNYLDWSVATTATRVLAVISDGTLQSEPLRGMISSIEQSGVRVLWCAPTVAAQQNSARHITASTHTMQLGVDNLIQTVLSLTSGSIVRS